MQDVAHPCLFCLIMAAPFLACPFRAISQTLTNDNNSGLPANGVFDGSKIASVQINNGNLHIDLPVWSAKGRGIDTGFAYYYDNKHWAFATHCNVSQGVCFDNVISTGQEYPLLLGSFNYQFVNAKVIPEHCPDLPGTQTQPVYENYELIEPDGTTHVFGPYVSVDVTCADGVVTNTVYAVDGSGWMMALDPSYHTPLYAVRKDGLKVYNTSRIIEDSNGNQLLPHANDGSPNSALSGTDTLGNVVQGDGSYYDSTGTRRYTTVTSTTSVAVQTSECTFSQSDSCTEVSYTDQFPQTIKMTNGDVYSFTYAQNQGGEPTSITLPGGASISFTWGAWDTGGRRVATKTIQAGGISGTWKYVYGPLTSNSITVTDPALNDTVYTCSDNSPNPCYFTKEAHYIGSATGGTLLMTKATDYNLIRFTKYTGAGYIPIRETTTWNQVNLVKKKETDWDLYSYAGGTPTWSNPVEVRQYDWGTGAAGALLTRTHINYKHLEPSSPYLTANIADLPASKIVYDASGTPQAQATYTYDGTAVSQTSNVPTHDAAYGPSNNLRGNLTQESEWNNATNSWLNSNYSYNDRGDRLTYKDPKSNQTSYDYTDKPAGGCTPSQPSLAFPTTITDALGHRTVRTYFYCTGQVHNTQDENDLQAGRPGTTYTYDLMDRPLVISSPDGGQTSYAYNDTARTVDTKTLMTSSTSTEELDTYDGLGRITDKQILSDPQGTDSVVTTYDPMGRVASVSHPQRAYGAPTDGTSTFAYDSLSRLLLKCNNPDNGTSATGPCTAKNSYREWVYSGAKTDIYDEQRHHWQQTADGLGRLTMVKEPDSSNTPTFETDYTYDWLSNLKSVNQKGRSGTDTARVRTFTYDSLSGLVCASNPENGTGATCPPSATGTIPQGVLHYVYDADGNVSSRTDARGVVTNYTYDALNRVTFKAYVPPASPVVPIAPTSNVQYIYDVAIGGWGWVAQTTPSLPSVSQTNLIGRLSQVLVGSPGANAWTVYGYDEMGRTVLKSECLPIDCGNNHHDLHYKYDLAGRMAFYDRGLDAVRNHVTPNSGFYFGGFTMGYDGANNLSSVTGDTAGTNRATNILSNTDYFPTGQPYTELALGAYNLKYSMNAREWVTGQVITNTAGTSIWNSSTSFNNNGTVSVTTDKYAGAWSYSYDPLNRISTASGPNGATLYTIDAFGNKSVQTTTRGVAPHPIYGVDGSNRLTGTGVAYDAAGNLVQDGSGSIFRYDAEERLYSVNGTTCYTYDGDGDRVAMTNCNVVNHGDGTTTGILSEYLYDASHRLMTEVNVSTEQMTRANIYAGSVYLAEDTSAGTLLRVTDTVGTLRGLLDLSGNTVNACTSFPYGDGMNTNCQSGPGLFTNKDRDSVSGLDYFGARYYSSNMGRFTSPDWSYDLTPIPYADLENPQTLNLYAYVQNDPLGQVDIDGHVTDLHNFDFYDITAAFLSEHGDQLKSSWLGNQVPARSPQYDPNCDCFRMNAKHPSIDDAAVEAERMALAMTLPVTREHRMEYGGALLRGPGGQIAFTRPVTFKGDPGDKFCRHCVKIPHGYRAVAYYHTHPHVIIEEGQGFSDRDAAINDVEHTTDYVADTVSKNVYRYDAGDGWDYGQINGHFIANAGP